MAAVLYVFRCLCGVDIPLNAGCLEPLDIRVKEPSILRPRYPAAVVAGNVETSQYITDALFGALNAVAESQGRSIISPSAMRATSITRPSAAGPGRARASTGPTPCMST